LGPQARRGETAYAQVQVVAAARERARGQPAALLVGQLPRPAHELGGDHFGVGVLFDLAQWLGASAAGR